MGETIKRIKFNEILEKLNYNKLSPYNFYNIDIGYDQYFSNLHYKKHLTDNIETPQILKKVFLDIEVFLNHHPGITIQDMLASGEFMVNAISHYYSDEKKYYSYIIPPKNNNFSEEEYRGHFINESRKLIKVGEDDSGNDIYDKYLEDDEDIVVEFFKDSLTLVTALFTKIKKSDPAILSSFNGDKKIKLSL